MNKPKNTMKVSFPSRGANEGLARMLVAAFITEADPTVEELCDIKTAVSEAVTNCLPGPHWGDLHSCQPFGKQSRHHQGAGPRVRHRRCAKGDGAAVYHRRQRTGRAGLCGDAGADG